MAPSRDHHPPPTPLPVLLSWLLSSLVALAEPLPRVGEGGRGWEAWGEGEGEGVGQPYKSNLHSGKMSCGPDFFFFFSHFS